jgi:antitoxin MazE
MNSVRSTRPISRSATANSCCRGYEENFRKSWLGCQPLRDAQEWLGFVGRLVLGTFWIYITGRISAWEVKIQVAKWGNSLAVRLPAELVRELGLKEGDQIDLVKDDGRVRVRRLARADEVLTGLRRFRGKLSAAERLSRDDAHER